MSWRGAKHGIKRWEADKQFSLAIRTAANHECQHCHKPATDCAHIVGREDFTVRWCTDNAVSLCRYCHDHFGSHPIDFVDWIDALWPGRRDRIQVRRRGKLGNTAENRKLIAAHYRQQLAKLSEDPDHTLVSWN